MTYTNNKFELLAPAGDFKSAMAAINAGANALYVGMSKYSARAYANNFTDDELISLIKYCHIFDIKIYLAVNTLFKEYELNELCDFLKPCIRAGADGIIMQDLGAIKLVHKTFPEIEIHGSTQLTASTAVEVNFYESIGLTRVVLSRELSLDEIKNIKENTNIELECFIHGALCYSYSGRCLMSSFLGGRSANRGRCAGTCRLEYECNGETGHLLSLRDMNTLKDIYKLVDAGAYSLKIEGRMKKPEYVAGVTSIYSEVLSQYKKYLKDKSYVYPGIDKLVNKLNNIYSRGGRSTSYLYIQNNKNMISKDKAGYHTDENGEFQYIKEKYIDKNIKCNLTCDITVVKDSPIYLNLYYKDKTFSFVSDYVVSESNSRPCSKEDIYKTICASGDSPFVIDILNINLDENVFVPNKVFKELRRNALNEIINNITEEYINNRHLKSFGFDYFDSLKTKSSLTNQNSDVHKKTNDLNTVLNIQSDNHNLHTIIAASCENIEQFETLVNNELINRVYISYRLILNNFDKLKCIREAALSNSKEFYISLPYILRQKNCESFKKLISLCDQFNCDGYLCRDIAQKLILSQINDKPAIADATIYAFNSISSKFLIDTFKFKNICVSYESTKSSFKSLICNKMEIPVYGRVPLMVTANCLQKTTLSCDKQDNIINLHDRKNMTFKVQKHCAFCYNVIYNSLPSYYVSSKDEIDNFKFNSIRFDFVDEDVTTVNNILNNYFYNKKLPNNMLFTNGHIKKGVE